MRLCEVTGCGREHRARGYCQAHWKRWKRYGDPDMKVTRTLFCSVCDKKHYSKGYCNKHYWKLLKYNDPLFVKNYKGGLKDTYEFYIIRQKGCWGWKGTTNHNGYGVVTVSGKRYLVHRLSWMLHKGSIPAGLLVCHHCDSPTCSNPEHLYLGTNNAKLTEKQVVDIRSRLSLGDSQVDIAKDYKVSNTAVYNIARRHSWAWL